VVGGNRQVDRVNGTRISERLGEDRVWKGERALRNKREDGSFQRRKKKNISWAEG